MQRALSILSIVGVAALASVSAHAACGGGGYKPSAASNKPHEASREKQSEGKNSKLADAQRDVDKAQAKFDRCEGDCEKERRKLEEAKAKYAKKASEG